MCPKVKRYKQKEMGTFSGAQNQQKACLEGDTDSEGKEKKLHCNISEPELGSRRLETQRLHLGFLVDIVLPRVAKAVLEPPAFGGQSPNQTLPRGQGLGL